MVSTTAVNMTCSPSWRDAAEQLVVGVVGVFGVVGVVRGFPETVEVRDPTSEFTQKNTKMRMNEEQ